MLLFLPSLALAQGDPCNEQIVQDAKAFAAATGTPLNQVLKDLIQQRINEFNNLENEKDHKASSDLGFGEIEAWDAGEKAAFDIVIDANLAQISIYAQCFEKQGS